MLDADRLADVLLAATEALMAKRLAALMAANAALEAKLDMLQARDLAAEVKALLPDAPDFEALARNAVAAPLSEALAALEAKSAVLEPPDVDAAVRAAVGALPAAKDGRGVASARQNDDGELILKLTDGETLNVGRVRGADGFGFDHLEVEDGEREFALVFARGAEVKRFALAKGVILDRGVWRPGEFKAGDGVTWGGSFFIAQRDTGDKPETSDAWRLSVKRGRDGRDGVVKAEALPEPIRIGKAR